MKLCDFRRAAVLLTVLSAAMLACGPVQLSMFVTPTSSVAVAPTQPPDTVSPTIMADATASGNEEAGSDPTVQPTELPQGTPAAPIVEGDASLHRQAMRSGFEADVDQYAEGLRYAIELAMTDDPLRLEGTERVLVPNTHDAALDEIVFRLYPNGLSAQKPLTIHSAAVDGQAAEPELLSQETAVGIPLSQPLAPGDSAVVELDFTFEMQTEGLIGYGRIANTPDIKVLSSFLPLLSVYQQGEWWTEFPSTTGDPAYSESALFDVTLTLPDELQAASSGTTLESFPVGDGLIYYRFVTGPMRDFSLTLTRDFEVMTGEQDGVIINVWSEQGAASADEYGLEVTAESVRIFDQEFGLYPFKEMDVIQSPLSGAGGVEYPGVYYVEAGIWDPNMFFYEIVLVHETAHQWWYSTVGNNQVGEPWLDESLAQYSVEVYFRERYGDSAGRGVRDSYEATVDSYLAEGNERMPVGLPVEAYRDEEYFVYVYNAGPLLLSHFAEDYGDEAVSELLTTYYNRYRYAIAHTSDLEQLVETQLGPEALDLFEQWVYGE